MDNNNLENNRLNEGQASPQNNIWSVLSPLLFTIIVIALMVIFAN